MSTSTAVVAISGKSGCGNSTVSRMLAERLGRRLINYTFHTLANELDIPFKELLERAKTDYSYDRMLDRKQIQMARENDSVIGSRLAIWLLPDAQLTVYLYADPEVRAKRIHMREGGNLTDIIAFTKQRDAMDTERYRNIYQINNDDYQFADLIINTNRLNPGRIVDIIEAAL